MMIYGKLCGRCFTLNTKPACLQIRACKRKQRQYSLYRRSYMSDSVLLNLLNKLVEQEIKCEACRAFYLFFPTSLISSIIKEPKC